MKLILCKDAQDAAQQSSQWCSQKVSLFFAKSMYVPAGDTPLPLYEIWEKTNPPYLKGLALVQIDDIVTGPKQGLFKQFLKKNLPSYQKNFRYLNQETIIADIGILGLGLNGHVAFHEPNAQRPFIRKKISLTGDTLKHLGLNQAAMGISYGLDAFLETKALLLLVTGKSKHAILNRFLAQEPQLPASALHAHPDLTVIIDAEAQGQLRLSSDPRYTPTEK